ncbi:MAG: hypothetical protein ABR955_00530 [Verrucomicrobiota bacterium]
MTPTIVAVAIAAAAGSVSGVYMCSISSIGSTEAEIIRRHCPIRLIQPEWVNSQPDLLLNWTLVETKARLALVAVLWLCGISVIVH